MSLRKSSKLQALLIQLEFPTWDMARPWTYSANFAIQEGLEANGFECHTIPAIPASSSPSYAPWLQHAEQLCRGKQFDLVWVWLVHCEYDRRFLDWIASMAPVRVGFVMESLSYTEEEQRFSPVTLQRAAIVAHQLGYLTHAVVVDELDAEAMNAKGATKAFWCPSFVPERFIVPPDSHPLHNVAAFHGTPYGHRRAWLEHPALQRILVTPATSPTKIQRLFDQMHLMAAELLRKQPLAAQELLPRYLSDLRQIRLAEYTQWMKDLRQWTCIINLPGFQKGYGGRVYEAMAEGRPVISWDIPNRPQNRSLFEDGTEILLFSKDDPSSLAEQIARVLEQKEYAFELARNANRKMVLYHTAEKRIQQILEWIESGAVPSFSDGAQAAMQAEPTLDGLQLRAMWSSSDRLEALRTKVNAELEPAIPGGKTGPGGSHSPRSGLLGSDPMRTQSCSQRWPTVSIIIPCFKQAQFLPDAVESVVAQTYADWECLIVDDGSPDNTEMVATQLIAAYPSKRFRLIRKANGGLADARNVGIRAAQGQYILPLDADDRLHPEYLKDTVPILDHCQDIAIVYVDEHNFGETTHIHRKGVSNLSNLLHGNVHDYCTLYRREVWETVGGYSPAMYLGAEDWSFWIGAAKYGFQSYHIEKPLFLYRNRSGTMVAQVHANINVVKAHLVLHHPDLFQEADQASAKATLSQLNADNHEKLVRVCAIHPENTLLKLFQRLAQTPTGMPMPVQWEKEDGHMHEQPFTSEPQSHEHDDAYYADLFTKNPEWSTPEPNDDETARWVKIAAFLEYIVRMSEQNGVTGPVRILDLGCGRGWLANLASSYGECTGVEPVAEVVAHARRLFPHVRFYSGTADMLLQQPGFQPFDIVLSSEVIEHVTRQSQPAFVQLIRRLVKPNGYVIVTTPRGEVFDLWRKIAPPNQPIEDWLTEKNVRHLFMDNRFACLGNDRVSIELPSFRFIPAPTPADHQSRKLIPFYQVWAWQAPGEDGMAASTKPFDVRPLVSVIVPTYNRPDRLCEAIKSIYAQTCQDFEVIVVNDGEVDVNSVVAGLNLDGRIRAITHDRNRGLAAARNTGLRAAKGIYIAYLDDDDRYYPEHLETLVKALQGSEHKAAYTDAWRLHEVRQGNRYVATGRDLPYSYDFNPADLLVSNYFPVLCVMHERQCLDQVGYFDESLFAHEDWDLWIRMATKFPFVHIKRTTAEFTWRMDGSSMTSSTRDTYRRTTEIIYRKYRPYAERISGVLEAQQERLRSMHSSAQPKTFDCSIIIPVWNKVEFTRQCLTALGPATEDVSFELIVVDNGSTDGTKEFLASLGGDVRIITNQANLGFAKACNQGAAAAHGRYLVFLNNDTIPVTGWLDPLVQEVTDHPDTAVVGSKLLYPDRTVQHAGIGISRMTGLPYHVYKGFDDAQSAVNRRRELNAVTGACMLVRREAFRDCGGFDEGYVNGFEDADLCLKIRERHGVIVYQPKSVLIHLESQTEGRDRHTNANGQRFLQRWGQSWWLVDDDTIYFDDGYKAVSREENGRRKTDLHRIASEQERQAWGLVTDTQRAAHHQDLPRVEALLQRPAEWPVDSSILQWAASVAKAMKLPSVAEEFRRRVECLNDPAFRDLEEIRAALTAGQLSMALSRVDALLKQYPAHAEALLLRAILHMQREQYREAEIAFTTALNQGANRKKCLMGIGMASMGRAYPQGAWQTFLRVLAENPDDADVIHWLLRAGTAQNRWRELSVQLHNFLARNPSDLSVRFAYAGVLLRADQVDASRQEYDQLRALAPTYEGLVELGQAIATQESVLAMNVSNA